MKLSYFILLFLIILILSGCAQPSALAPASTPVSASTTAPASSSSDIIRLYYYGPSAVGVDPAMLTGTHCIYSASSSDGINFKEDPGVRFSYDTKSNFGITDPDVVRLNDGSWLMFASLGENLVKAVSPTSSGTFTSDNTFHWDRGGVPGSFNFDGVIRTFMCYQGSIHMAIYDQKSGTLTDAGVALASPPSGGIIADPSVIKVGNEYLMFYKYAASPVTPPTEHEIYLATSADGINWSQHNDNKFIGKGSVPGAVYYNGTIYVYYCGQAFGPGPTPPDFGVAISHDNGTTFTFATVTISGKVAAGAADPSAVVVSPVESIS
jgi:hypothetical protein